MTPQELESIGLALYGPRWRSRLAEVLGRDRSTVCRWAMPAGHASHRPMPGVVVRRVLELAGGG